VGPCEAFYACCAKIEELDLASGLKQLQFLSRYQRDFAENAGSNCPKWIRSKIQTQHTVFETERYCENAYSRIKQVPFRLLMPIDFVPLE